MLSVLSHPRHLRLSPPLATMAMAAFVNGGSLPDTEDGDEDDDDDEEW